MAGELVLVTGGSGFIGAHAIVQALARGLPSPHDACAAGAEGDVRAMVEAAGVEAGDRLSLRRRRSFRRRGMARGRRRLRLCAARGLAVSRRRAQAMKTNS